MLVVCSYMNHSYLRFSSLVSFWMFRSVLLNRHEALDTREKDHETKTMHIHMEALDCHKQIHEMLHKETGMAKKTLGIGRINDCHL